MSVITTSNAVLEVKVVFDISGTTPVINLTNESTGDVDESPIPPLDDLVWALNIYSPSGTPIYTSSFDEPFQTGVWTTASITNQWPRPFNQIEWSGADYKVEFQIQDTDGTIYYINKAATICRPYGNNKKSTDTFGHVELDIQTICERAAIYVQDVTSKTYRGITGINISSYLAIDYPRDPTGTLPAPYEITSFSVDALVPFTYNGVGYEATYYSIYQYDLTDNVFLNIRYVKQTDFDVLCNVDLCPLACEVAALENSITNGTCADVADAQYRLSLITPKLLRAYIAKSQPACGIDLAALIEEIKEIGGFSCDCVNGATGIGSQSALVDGVLFNVVKEGGDVQGRFEADGNNVTLYISDKSYTFGQCNTSQTDSVKLKTSTSGYNTTVCLDVNLADFAEDLYILTLNNTYLRNLFNSIVIGAGGGTVAVDAKCILDTNPHNDYTWEFENIPTSSSSNALFTTISVAGVPQTYNYLFNTTTLVAFQTYLNTLGLGTFVVTAGASGNVSIESTSNTNNLSNFKYKVGSTTYVATQTTVSTGVQEYTESEIIQAIIDYFCPFEDTKIITSQAYDVCYINESGEKVTETIDAETGLDSFITSLLARGCTTIDWIINNNGGLSCASVGNIFQTVTTALSAGDYVLGNKNGACVRITPDELFSFMLSTMTSATRVIFCEAVASCGAGLICEPYNELYATVVEHSTTCTAIVGIEGNVS